MWQARTLRGFVHRYMFLNDHGKDTLQLSMHSKGSGRGAGEAALGAARDAI